MTTALRRSREEHRGPPTASSDATVSFTDERGYTYIEMSNAWKAMCSGLPCRAAMPLPGYDTRVVEDMIDGQPVVIQLWKGWCPRSDVPADFAGGIGAEVGVYRRIAGTTDLARYASVVQDTFDPVAEYRESDLWWPWPELGATICFELVDPATDEALFSADPRETYWLTRWMTPSSWERRKRSTTQRIQRAAMDYRLDYVINGKAYRW